MCSFSFEAWRRDSVTRFPGSTDWINILRFDSNCLAIRVESHDRISVNKSDNEQGRKCENEQGQ